MEEPVTEKIEEVIEESWVRTNIGQFPSLVHRITSEERDGVAEMLRGKLDSLRAKIKKRKEERNEWVDLWGELTKTTLLSGLFVAHVEENEYDYLKQIFFGRDLFDDSEKADKYDKALLTELAFLEQHLSRTNQIKLKNEVIGDSVFGDNNLDKWRPWTPPFREYWRRWQIREMKGENPSSNRQDRTDTSSESNTKVIAVVSLKGGVGKSIITGTIAKYLANLDEDKRPAIIDLDANGPSTQFTFHVPLVRETLGSVALPVEEETFGCDNDPSEKQPEEGWTYSSWADVFMPSNGGASTIPEAKIDEGVSGGEQYEENIRYFLIPDSPLYSAEVKVSDGSIGSTLNVEDSLRNTIDGFKDSDTDYVIIDFHPGISGSNGSILRLLEEEYDTTVLCVTSPRAPDLAGTLSEILDLNGIKEFENSPKLIVNKWEYSSQNDDGGGKDRPVRPDSRRKELKKGFVEYMDKITSRILGKDVRKMTSGDLIYTWRLWSYLYLRIHLTDAGEIRENAPPRWMDFDLCVLPEDKILRTAMNPVLEEELNSQSDDENSDDEDRSLHVRADWCEKRGIMSTDWATILTEFVDKKCT